MKQGLAGLLLIAALASLGCASSMQLNANLRLRNAPPPPSLSFSGEPQFRDMPRHHVSAIADDGFGYDLFNSGGTFYLYSSGFWYRSSSARGQYVAIDSGRVPKPIFDVDDSEYHWRSRPEGLQPAQAPRDNGNRSGGEGGKGN